MPQVIYDFIGAHSIVTRQFTLVLEPVLYFEFFAGKNWLLGENFSVTTSCQFIQFHQLWNTILGYEYLWFGSQGFQTLGYQSKFDENIPWVWGPLFIKRTSDTNFSCAIESLMPNLIGYHSSFTFTSFHIETRRVGGNVDFSMFQLMHLLKRIIGLFCSHPVS